MAYGVAELLEEIERDLAWREAEVSNLKRVIARTEDNATQLSLRRAFIALLYSHAEGGIKTALTAYVRVINERALRSGDCNAHLAASAWDDVFRTLENPSRIKGSFFTTRLPDDTKLHRFGRRADFVLRIREIGQIALRIREAAIVDTEGNIDDVVLSKIMYRLGFPPDVIGKRFKDLQYLRALRNPIAHGESSAASDGQCAKYEKVVFGVLTRLRDLLAKAVREETFLRRSAA